MLRGDVAETADALMVLFGEVDEMNAKDCALVLADLYHDIRALRIAFVGGK